jgi:hypothetical protein
VDAGAQPSAASPASPAFPLLAVFHAEFDNTVGPRISFAAPPGLDEQVVPLQQVFRHTNMFIITTKEMSNKLIFTCAARVRVRVRTFACAR